MAKPGSYKHRKVPKNRKDGKGPKETEKTPKKTEKTQKRTEKIQRGTILEESMMSLEDKLSRDFRYLNIGCKLPIK